MRCDQCEYAFINGKGCHETGCPNSKKAYDIDLGWVKVRECFACGYTVMADRPCCNDELEYA